MLQRMAMLLLLAPAGLCAPIKTAHAADPQSYQVDITQVGDSDIDATLKSSSDLLALRRSAPVSPFGLIARARNDVDRLTTVVESFGYYEADIQVQINGMKLNNPGLAEVLNALPKDSDAKINVGITLGPLYHLGKIDIDGETDGARAALKLATGDAAVAADVLAGTARLWSALQERGHAFAKVDPPVAHQAAHEPLMDLRFQVVAGPRVNFGEIHFEGLRRVRASLLRTRLALHTGDSYSPSAIERARQDLLRLGVFGQVSVQLGTAVDSTGGVPLTFKIRERPRHAVALTAAYSSDLGGSGGVTWSDRNVFGGAEQLSVAASVINLGGSDTRGIGYDTSVKYLLPDFLRRDQSLGFSVEAIKQSLKAYDQTARTANVTLGRKLSRLWSASAGLTAVDEQVIQQHVRRDYTLLAVPLVLAFDSTGLTSPLEDPRRGLRASVSVAPTFAIAHPNATFVITQVKAAAYFDLEQLLGTAVGRSVLAARGLAGIAQGAGEFSLPPTQRFYGGGSGTIRGYGYQTVGPKFSDQTPIGGTAILAGALELRQRFGASLGAVLFVDAGQVSSKLDAVRDEFRVGVGTGVRYFTPIGPIRFDVAVPIRRKSQEDKFEIYIGLGQAF